MSQHDIESCGEGSEQWLPLTEYSVRSGISTSTIRRKIKSNAIQYKLEDGRYLILYSEPENKPLKAKTSVEFAPAHKQEKREPTASVPRTAPKLNKSAVNDSVFPIIDRSVQMATSAYERALKEKDERIRLLKDQNQALKDRLEELRTLVQALEEKYEVRY